jgi:adenylate cyclase
LYRDVAVANVIGGLLVSAYYGTTTAKKGSGGDAYWIVNVLGALGLAGGLAAITLTYLLVEHELRPVLARALEERPGGGVGGLVMRRRLLLVWALGSGIPLLGVALTPVVRDSHAPLPWGVPVAVLAMAGILAGAAITMFTARSIADPLTEIRNALLEVRQGHLDKTLTVNDAGEIGLLQSGFNEMVTGLREREQLQDLFGRHVGEDVARSALTRGAALGGEHRSVTVFFVDLIGSTAMARDRSPEDVVAALNDFFAAVVDAVTDEGGWVNKFEGDGAMCVFGAPGDQPDHTARALAGADALHRRLDDLGIEAGIGMATGEVVAGNVGTEARYEYTVIGHPVNEAARLTEAAKRRTPRVLSSLSGPGWEPAGVEDLRGIGAVEVYTPATGSPASPVRARSPRTAP